jgi:hypothetical protein
MRALPAFILIVVLVLAGCRDESERAAMAGAPDVLAQATTAVSDAGTRLDAPATRLRRLWSGSLFAYYASSPSPDGRYVTDIDWSSGDLAVRDLATGGLHRLTDKGSWAESADYAQVSRFSPDGRRVVYGWYVAKADEYEIRVLELRG